MPTPSYLSFIIHGLRTDAQKAILGFANAMERHKTENMAYTGATTGSPASDIGAPETITLPSQTPIDSTDKFYSLRIVAADSLNYTLRATAIAGTSQASDGLMEVISTGIRRRD